MTIPLTTTHGRTVKPLKIKTNNNQKLSCHYFCHIQIAGTNGIPESVAEKTTFRISTEDKSHPPVDAEIIDSVTCALGVIPAAFTWLSHAMDKREFINKVLKDVPGATIQTEMKIYFYKKM